MIALLEPLFQGDHARHGEALQCAPQPPADAVSVAHLLQQPALLLDLLHRQARHLGADLSDLRPVASAWSLEYLGMWLPPMVAGASVLQHVFPAAPEQVWVRFDAHGDPVSFHVRELGHAMPGTPVAQRYAVMFWQHLEPLFSALHRLTRLAPKILWSNTARHLETILDEALALTGGAAAIAQDRRSLLDDATWQQVHAQANVHAHAQANVHAHAQAHVLAHAQAHVHANAPAQATARAHPLHAPRRHVLRTQAGRRETVELYRHCCLNHLLPEATHCSRCPLAPEHLQDRKDRNDLARAQAHDT